MATSENFDKVGQSVWIISYSASYSAGPLHQIKFVKLTNKKAVNGP